MVKLKINQFKYIFKFINFINFKRINNSNSTNIFYKYFLAFFFLLYKKNNKLKINYFKNNLLMITFKNRPKGDFNIELSPINFLYENKILNLYSKYCKFLIYFNKKIEENFIFLLLKGNWLFKYNKKKNFYNIRKESKKITKMGTNIINITFANRNIFFNISTTNGKTLHTTTTRREGHVGRNRNSYNALIQVLKVMRKLLKKYFGFKKGNLIIILKG
jgi:hypothetical protein